MKHIPYDTSFCMAVLIIDTRGMCVTVLELQVSYPCGTFYSEVIFEKLA